MSLETTKIHYDAPAVLNLMQVPTGKPIEYLRGGKAAEGMLSKCVRWYMDLPQEAKFGANIVFDEYVIEGVNGMLQPGDIEIVAGRDDFPG